MQSLTPYPETAKARADVLLIERCLDGDEEAWSAFIARTMPAIRRAAWAVLNRCSPGANPDHESIDDIAQMAYVGLYLHDCRLLRRFDPERGSLDAWIGGIARCVARKWIAHVARLSRAVNFRDGMPIMVPLDEAKDIAVAPIAVEAAMIYEALAALEAALTPKEREFARWNWGTGLSLAETAEKMHIDIKTAYAHKRNISNKLRKMQAE